MAQDFGRRLNMFLRFLGETGRVKHAWVLAGGDANSITNLYARRRKDTDFAKAWAEAMEQAGDAFEDEAVRRAKEGVLKDVYYKGEVVGQERVYSDGLMSKLLDGSKPEKYAPKKDTTPVNVQIGLAVIPMLSSSEQDWERQALEHVQSQPQLIELTAKEVLPIPAISSKKVVVV